MFTFFYWSENIPFHGQFSDKSFNGFEIDLWDNFNILTEISLCPWDLLISKDFRIFEISGSFMLTELTNDVEIEAPLNGNCCLLKSTE